MLSLSPLKAFRFGILGILVLFWTGCSSVSLKELTEQYYEGNAKKAFELAQQGIKNREIKNDKKSAGVDDLLWQIEAGLIGFNLQSPKALELLEGAEERIKEIELQGLLSSLFENFGAMLVNDRLIPYRAYLYEGVMVNYYKALYFMHKGDYANSRVELNRASDRQRRIKDYYAEEILKSKEAQTKSLQSSENTTQRSSSHQAIQTQKILQSYSNLSEFKNLNGYINPFIDYVSGIFFYIQGDKSKAQDFLKESYGISQTPMIADDLALLSKNEKKKYTWLLIEDGRGPSKISREFSITLPIFTGDQMLIMNASLALPDAIRGFSFAEDYTLTQNQSKITQAQRIATLNPLFFNEFEKQLSFIVMRNVLSMATKLALQAGLSQLGGIAGILGNLGGLIYSRASTAADLRMASIIPNGFYALRFENKEGIFEIEADGRKIGELALSKSCDKLEQNKLCVSKHHMIYIRNAKHNVFRIHLISK